MNILPCSSTMQDNNCKNQMNFGQKKVSIESLSRLGEETENLAQKAKKGLKEICNKDNYFSISTISDSEEMIINQNGTTRTILKPVEKLQIAAFKYSVIGKDLPQRTGEVIPFKTRATNFFTGIYNQIFKKGYPEKHEMRVELTTIDKPSTEEEIISAGRTAMNKIYERPSKYQNIA